MSPFLQFHLTVFRVFHVCGYIYTWAIQSSRKYRNRVVILLFHPLLQVAACHQYVAKVADTMKFQSDGWTFPQCCSSPQRCPRPSFSLRCRHYRWVFYHLPTGLAWSVATTICFVFSWLCLNTVGGRVDSMPYGRPIIRSLSQNYHEAEVKYFFSPIFLSYREVAEIIYIII